MRAFITFVILVLSACDTVSVVDQPTPSGQYPADFIETVDGASAIFAGTVMRLHASNEPAVADWDQHDLIVVRVDATIRAPVDIQLPSGSEDTIILPAGDVAVGDQVYFFVTSQIAGQHWVFNDVGHLHASIAPLAEFHANVHEVIRYLLDMKLSNRLLAADRVFVGIVDSIDHPPAPDCGSCPIPASATLLPRSTLRGPVEITPLVADFSESNGPFTGLHLEPREQSIFIVQSVEDAFALGNEDRLSMDQLERVRSLIASPPAAPVL